MPTVEDRRRYINAEPGPAQARRDYGARLHESDGRLRARFPVEPGDALGETSDWSVHPRRGAIHRARKVHHSPTRGSAQRRRGRSDVHQRVVLSWVASGAMLAPTGDANLGYTAVPASWPKLADIEAGALCVAPGSTPIAPAIGPWNQPATGASAGTASAA